ncbi:Cytochrome P450 [Penicillium occitanis (nom. inval.)]|nr:Cytochrome P450 [Penicillium occitanis (nom. inval.)]PCG93039.1 hypothetical protein PENOC_089610 [Penicillium occitanis (nom. inval.)]
METQLHTALTPLSPSIPQVVTTFGLLGVAFHLAVRNTEIDYRLWRLFSVYLLVWAGLAGIYVNILELSWLYALGTAWFAGLCFNVGLLSSIGTYRLLFHRLRKFPGPWGARLSRFYAVSLASKGLQYHLELQKLHEQYGDFVRTGPREISINRPSAVQAIHASKSACMRSTWYSQVSDDITVISLNSTRDVEVHRRRRRAWDRAFSVKSMATYAPRVRSKVDVFISQLRERAGQPVNLTEWTMFLTFDVMGVVGFSKDFQQLEAAKEHSAIKGLHDQMAALGLLAHIPWFLSLLGSIPGLSGSYGLFTDYCHKQVKEKVDSWKQDDTQDPSDVISWLLKAKKDNDGTAPPGEQALDEDGRLMIIAGSDTTGAALANALYFLTVNPSVYQDLQKQLDSQFSSAGNSFTYEQVRDIPYLEAIINETLRLKPAVPSGQPRVTPPGGLQIDEVWIPGDVNVVVPQYILQRDNRNFPEGDKFVPERWLVENKKKMISNEQAYFPFQLGQYSCAGRQLALMELRLAIVLVALNFDLALAPGETGVEFDQGAKDTFTLTLSALQVVMQERTRL